MPLEKEWKKSSYSGAAGACVEVRQPEQGVIEVRDTKNRDGGTLTFTGSEWAAFVQGARDGEFDPRW